VLLLVWFFTFDLSDKGDSINNYTIIGIALGILKTSQDLSEHKVPSLNETRKIIGIMVEKKKEDSITHSSKE